MRKSSEYRAMSRDTLQNNWNKSALATLIIYVISCVFGMSNSPSLQDIVWLRGVLSVLQVLVIIFLLMPLGYGFDNAMLSLVRKEGKEPTDEMFRYFQQDYSRSTPTLLLGGLATIGLGLVTLLIGSIILSYAYAMVPYLLRDNPDLNGTDALKRSREMMRGHKWDLFVLDLTFIGWSLLACLTLGIGFLWLRPYTSTTHAHFYEDLRTETVTI